MFTALATAFPFAYMSDDAVIAFTYIGMIATLCVAVYIPFRLGKRAANVSDPTEKIIQDTGRALTGTAFDPFARYGSPNLPGGVNVR